jgi:hypothetical protein
MVGFNTQKMLYEQIAWKTKEITGRMYEIEYPLKFNQEDSANEKSEQISFKA